MLYWMESHWIYCKNLNQNGPIQLNFAAQNDIHIVYLTEFCSYGMEFTWCMALVSIIWNGIELYWIEFHGMQVLWIGFPWWDSLMYMGWNPHIWIEFKYEIDFKIWNVNVLKLGLHPIYLNDPLNGMMLWYAIYWTAFHSIFLHTIEFL